MAQAPVLPAPGLGATQRRLLDLLKRRGQSTLGEIATEFGLSGGTLREHLNALGSRGLVTRAGTRRSGPGRPEVVYQLTPAAESLFPNRDGEVLAELVRYLMSQGHEALLRRFFESRAESRRETLMARVEGKRGRERLEEVARILSEEGFMAEIEEGADEFGGPVLTLCHCPLKEAVAVTSLPCEAELALVQELLGPPSLDRAGYMPDGDQACSYRQAR